MLGDRLDCAETLLKAGANVREFIYLHYDSCKSPSNLFKG